MSKDYITSVDDELAESLAEYNNYVVISYPEVSLRVRIVLKVMRMCIKFLESRYL
jgi:hypothetical protein